MARVKLRQPDAAQGDGATAAQAIPLQMRVSGFVVRRRDLVETLRVVVPQLADVRTSDDGELFFLMLSEGEGNEDSVARQ